jgi:hypothetical protein
MLGYSIVNTRVNWIVPKKDLSAMNDDDIAIGVANDIKSSRNPERLLYMIVRKATDNRRHLHYNPKRKAPATAPLEAAHE